MQALGSSAVSLRALHKAIGLGFRFRLKLIILSSVAKLPQPSDTET